MLSNKLKIRLSLLAGILSWLLFVFFDLYLLFIEQYQLNVELSELIPQFFLTSLVFSAYLFFRYSVIKAESINFTELLWRIFLTGLVTTIGSLLTRSFFVVFGNSTFGHNPITINFLYHVLIGLVVIFLVSTFVVWKRLILYQKTKNLLQLWSFFEYGLLGGLVYDFIGYKFLSIPFNSALIFLGGMGLVLSFNLKWIAYLNYKQKWKSILFILLTGVYMYHFLRNLTHFSETSVLTMDLMDRVSFVSVFVFILTYGAISTLVALFNLPTSSVFERKLQEAIDFQKLSQSIPTDQNAEQTYELLLDSSMSAVFADAAWLEILEENALLKNRRITRHKITEIKSAVKQDHIRKIMTYDLAKNTPTSKVIGSLNHPDFKSIIAIPIFIKGEQTGVLVLLQEVSDAFNKEMVDIISTFVNQASISLENFKLLQEALENERYKEELKIAKSVQKSLLPNQLDHNNCFEIEAFSMAADEVGGDYYDIISPKDGVYNLIIGDVSGKGTSAAFNMAQMKGVFHSLAHSKISAREFISNANMAVGQCLEKQSFITAIFFVIDTNDKKLSYVRAGHCPAMYYSAQSGEIRHLSNDGLGLGIIRNSTYNEYVEEETLNYHPGDVLLMYTDGITEAKTINKQQYGVEGLHASLLNHISAPIDKLKDLLIEDLINFLDGNKLDDDYTLTVVRFKE